MHEGVIVKKLKWFIEYFFYRLGVILLSSLPVSLSLGVGRAVGLLGYLLDSSHKRIALGNLRRASIGKDEEERKAIMRRNYKNFGMNFAEFIRLREMAQSWVKFEGVENVYKAKSMGKGIFFLSGHFGNWELEAAAHAIRFGKAYVIAKDVKNTYVDRHVKAQRNSCNLEVIKPRRSIYRILRILRAKGDIGILLDQDTSHREGVFVDFFGQKACTQSALAIIALKTGVPVVPGFIRRNADGTHTLRYLPPIILDNTGDRKTAIVEYTQLFTSIIESQIRDHPDQWLWVHRRWKTRPL